MNNTNATKNALLFSVIAMLLCVTMLIGTTFAWFTDSAISRGNKIQAGTLNIDLLVKGDSGYVSVKDTNDAIFNYDKWEPGYTEVRNVKVSTAGTLALEYTLKIVPQIATEEALKLAEAIDVYYANSEVNVDNRNLSGLTKIGTLKSVFTNAEGTIIDDTLIPDSNTEDFATIVLKMQETAGNEYQGLSVGNGFDLNVLATQYTYEKDSFDDQYDAGATYPEVVSTVAGIREAIEQGKANILITNDITIDDGIQISVKDDTAINFNGNTLKGAVESGSISSSDGPTNLVLSDPNNSGEYSIDSNIVRHEGGGYTQLSAITVWKPTVTIESGKYTHDSAVILCQLQTQDPDAVGVVINGGTFAGKGAASVIANVFGNVIVNNGEFNAHFEGESSGECVYVSSGNSYVPSVTTINGGTFNAEKRIFYVKVNTSYTQKIVVNGGTFNVADGGNLIEVSSGDASDYLTITGGTFNVDPSAYVDTANYKVTHTGSTWTVTAK